MPNHFHAVLIIGNNPYNTKPITVRNLNCNTGCNGECNSFFNLCGHFVHNSDFYDIRREAMHCVSTKPHLKQITEIEALLQSFFAQLLVLRQRP